MWQRCQGPGKGRRDVEQKAFRLDLGGLELLTVETVE